MQFSKRTQYGIRALVHFAQAYERGYLQSRDLSAREKMPPRFLESILNSLTRGKYLVSKIGNSGGYRLAKPPKEIMLGEIVARLDEAIEAYARRQAENSASRVATLHFPGREPLTRREREVLEQFTAGASNKEAGRHLGISPRTIEDHRANIMKKLGARNAADLVRIVMTTSRQA